VKVGATLESAQPGVSEPPAVARVHSPDGEAFVAVLHQQTAWRVAEAPNDASDRRAQVTGTVDPKMMINALNSGAHSAEFVPFLSLSGHNQLD
jgi:hypothetical protein